MHGCAVHDGQFWHFQNLLVFEPVYFAEEVLKSYKDLQAATSAELAAKLKSIPKQSATYNLDTVRAQTKLSWVLSLKILCSPSVNKSE